MIDLLTLAILAIIAATLLALLWRSSLPRLNALPNEIWRDTLTTRLQQIIAGLAEDQQGHGTAIEHLSETTARLESAVTDLRGVIDRLTLPCETCPARDTARRVARIERALEFEEPTK